MCDKDGVCQNLSRSSRKTFQVHASHIMTVSMESHSCLLPLERFRILIPSNTRFQSTRQVSGHGFSRAVKTQKKSFLAPQARAQQREARISQLSSSRYRCYKFRDFN